ncbi:hypothetical protein [Streptomyces olivaceoviridis]|uniref:hypothetical protein n=1 Tax=Streptomyces olivaceoviridis TaxID=1921 RepID=UPI00332CBA21
MAASEAMSGRGDRSVHRLSPPVGDTAHRADQLQTARIVGDRAFAETPTGVEVRTDVDGVTADLVSYTRLVHRLVHRLERRDAAGALWRWTASTSATLSHRPRRAAPGRAGTSPSPPRTSLLTGRRTRSSHGTRPGAATRWPPTCSATTSPNARPRSTPRH